VYIELYDVYKFVSLIFNTTGAMTILDTDYTRTNIIKMQSTVLAWMLLLVNFYKLNYYCNIRMYVCIRKLLTSKLSELLGCLS
jgi:hypothetical protein